MSRAPSRVERGLARLFGDDEPTTFGTGWMAGTGGVFLGVLAVAGTHGSSQTFGTAETFMAGIHAMHDLAGVEDDRMAALFAKVARKGAIIELDRQLPVEYALGAGDQLLAPEQCGGIEEGLDDVAAGLGIAGQPAILETPAGADATAVGMADTHILGAAEPVDGPMQMGQVVPDRLAATVEQISQNQLPVEWSPELVSDGDRQQFFEHVINEYREG